MKAKPHILFLNPRYDIPSPRSIRAKNITKHLKDIFQLSVICFSNELRNKQISKSNQIVKYNLPLSFLSTYVINKSYSEYRPKGFMKLISGIGNRIYRQLFVFPDEWIIEKKKVINALEKAHPEIIVASMFPYSMGVMAMEYKLLYDDRIKLIFDIGDPLTNNAASANNTTKVVGLEKELLTIADHLIVTNQETKDYFQIKYELEPPAISVVSQGIDIETFSIKRDRAKTNIHTMVYAGAFYESLRDPRLFFKASDAYSAQFQIQVFGNILDKFKISKKAVRFFGRVDQATLAEKYADSDALLYFDNKEGIQTSGKIYELLALKKPIVFLYHDENSTVVKLCKHYDHIFFIKNEADDIDDAFPKIRGFLNQQFDFNYDIKQFSWRSKADQFQQIIQQLLDG